MLGDREARVAAREAALTIREQGLAAREKDLANREQRLAAQTKPTAAPLTVPVAKLGRNDLCPCGSGLKYKRCHGA